MIALSLSEAVFANLRCQAELCSRIAGFAANSAAAWHALGAEIDALVRANQPGAAPPAGRAAQAPASAAEALPIGNVVRLRPLT